MERERGEAIAPRAYAEQNAQDATGRAETAELDARTSRRTTEVLREDRPTSDRTSPIPGPGR